MPRIHLLSSVQFIPRPLNEVWEFFSNPANLEKITPDSLHLKVTNKLFGTRTYAGQLISYTVRPLLGIPMSWLTEITHVQESRMFVDEQRKGPYALWHHEHHFEEKNGGTEMIDRVQFALPFGFLGGIALPLVKSKLMEIFNYRHQQIVEHYDIKDAPEPQIQIS